MQSVQKQTTLYVNTTLDLYYNCFKVKPMDKMFPELKYYYVTCSEQVDSRQLSVLFTRHSPQRRRVLYKSLAVVSVLGVVALVLLVRAQADQARETGQSVTTS